MAKLGRPSTFTQATADEICERLGNGEPLAQICRDEGMPALRTVYDWQKAHDDFSASIACARDAGYDVIAARLRMTARGKTDDDGGDSSGDVQRDKLIVDTDLKLLAKWDARRYGDKIDVTSGGEKLATEIGETERAMRLAAILGRDADAG
jgi:hypothetical protein